MVTPNSNITLLKTPMELSDANTLSFATETAKYNYFNSLTKLPLTGATYQRKDGVVRYPTTSGITFEDILEYNYCMYQNTSYDTKWFYAYITDIKYVNDGMVEITLKTDAFMTWQNDIVYKSSFIERQHVDDDTIGKHTIPENVETGEFIVNYYGGTQLSNSCHVVVMSAWNPVAGGSAAGGWNGKNSGSFINGIYQGCDFFLLGDDAQPYGIREFMNIMSEQSKLDSVIGLFMLPDSLTGYSRVSSWDYLWTDGTTNHGKFKKLPISGGTSFNDAISMTTLSIVRNTTLNGYVPKNNKLFTGQFNYIMMSNNSGGNFIYYYEDFPNNAYNFKVIGTITPGGSIKIFPLNYKGITDAMEYGFSSGKYPIGSFTGDMYTNWLTQNSVNFNIGNYDFNLKPGDVGIATGLMSIAGGIGLMTTGAGSLAGAGSILSGGIQIANSMGEIQRHEKIPPMYKGNSNAGDVIYSSNWLDFTYYQMSIKNEYAKMIDNYFSMYGYKVNSLEVINPHKRVYYDYIKTIGCNIIGNIPQKDLEEIRGLFDNGITIWHDTTKFLDYSVTNSIIS